VPHFWIPVPANPKRPKRMRDDLKNAVHRHHGRVIDDELFFHPGECTLGYATVECGEEAIGPIADEVHARRDRIERMLTADEADAACPPDEGESSEPDEVPEAD
jgi:hypothetical protein